MVEKSTMQTSDTNTDITVLMKVEYAGIYNFMLKLTAGALSIKELWSTATYTFLTDGTAVSAHIIWSTCRIQLNFRNCQIEEEKCNRF